MAVEDLSDYVGDVGVTPYDLMWARRDVIDYHRQYGMPVIIKRTYNSDHIAVATGPHGEEVYRDNTYDDVYGQAFYHPTGAISNTGDWQYSKGWFTYVTFSDVSLEIDPNARGVFKQVSPQGEMPYAPLLWEGDLMITVEITRNGNEVTIEGTGDRYIVQSVTPVTMRGEATPFYIPNQEAESNFYQDQQRFIAQKFQGIRMPRYHHVYDIAVV